MKTIKIFSILFSCIAISFCLHAQPSASTAVQQQQNFQQGASQQELMASLKAGTNVPEIYEGENADVGPQHILVPVPRRTYFDVKADSEYLFTDNATFAQNHPTNSTIFINTISAAFAPDAYRVGNGRLAPAIGIVGQWYNYGLGNHNLSSLDFHSETFFAGARYLLPNHWSLLGEFDYDRFLNQHPSYSEFYHDFTPIAGAQGLYKLNEKAVFVMDFKLDYHASWTAGMAGDSENRGDASAAFSVNYQVMPRLILQPYYRFQYTHYNYNTLHTSDRSDYLHNLGISTAYYFLPNLSLRAFANADVRESNDNLARYKAVSVGVDLAYDIRF